VVAVSLDAWVRFYLPTSVHGGESPTVLCKVPDSRGTLTVPASMINRYLSAGAVEQRTYDLARFTAAVVDIGNGRGVGLEIQAKRECDFYH